MHTVGLLLDFSFLGANIDRYVAVTGDVPLGDWRTVLAGNGHLAEGLNTVGWTAAALRSVSAEAWWLRRARGSSQCSRCGIPEGRAGRSNPE